MSRIGVWDFGRVRGGWRSLEQMGGTSLAERLALWMHRRRRWVLIALWSSVVAALAAVEVRTSWLQSRVLSEFDRHLSYQVEPGAGRPPLNAPRGPYDERLGYSKLEEWGCPLNSGSPY